MSHPAAPLARPDDAITTALRQFFDERIRAASSLHPRYELLWKELSRVTQNGGKRLRPKMLLLAYESCGGIEPSRIIPAGVALEILHAGLLIHDDIIDRDLIRHGESNITGVYDHEHYTTVSDPTLRRHYSDGAALLGGDLLIAASIELIQRCDLPADILQAAQTILHRIIFEVVGGQLLDSELSFLAHGTASAEHVARYKTASYSFIGPLLIGATMAGAPRETLKTLEEFATHLGIAFQLSDDLIGTFGDEHTTGKSTSSDLREGKMTYLVETFLATASPTDIAAFQASFGDPELSEMTAQSLKTLLKDSGALDTCRAAIETYEVQARTALTRLPLTQASRDAFEQLIARSTTREA